MKQLKKGTRLSKSLITAVIANIVTAKTAQLVENLQAREADLIEKAQSLSAESYGSTRDVLTGDGMFPLVDTLTFVLTSEEDTAQRIHFSEKFPIPYRTLQNGVVTMDAEQYEQVTAMDEACKLLASTCQSIESKLTEAFDKYDNAKDLVEEHTYVLDYLPEEYLEDAETAPTVSLDDLLGAAA